MGRDRLTSTNIGSYSQVELTPCNTCELDPRTCDQTYTSPVPGKQTDLVCKKYGVIEIIDLSVHDKSVKIQIPRKNGQSETDPTVPAVAEAAL